MVQVSFDGDKIGHFWYSTFAGRVLRALMCLPIALTGMVLAYPFASLSAWIFELDLRLPIVYWVLLWFAPSLAYCAVVGVISVLTHSADHLFSFAALLYASFRTRDMVIDRLMSGYMIGRDGDLYIRDSRYIRNGGAVEPTPELFFDLAYKNGELMNGLINWGFIGGGLVAGIIAFGIGRMLRESTLESNAPIFSVPSATPRSSVEGRHPKLNWPD